MTLRACLALSLFFFGKAYGTTIPIAGSDTANKNIKPPFVLKLRESNGIPLLRSGKELDSTLNLYEVHEPAYKGKIIYRGLGSFVSPAQPQWFSPMYTAGYSSGMYQNPIYELNSDNLNFFAAKKRYSEIDFVQGSRREQIIRLVHAQNIHPNMGVTFQLQRQYTNGLLLNQVNFSNCMGLGFYYVAPKGAYQTAVKWYTNRSQIGENGGLQSDSLYENTTQLPRNYKVQASQAKSTTRYSGVLATQQLRLFKADRDTVKKISQDGLFLTHQFSYYYRNRDFHDLNPTTSFYIAQNSDSNSYINSSEFRNKGSLLFQKIDSGSVFIAEAGLVLQNLLVDRKDYPGYDISNSGYTGSLHYKKVKSWGVDLRATFAGANMLAFSVNKAIANWEIKAGYLNQANYNALIYDAKPGLVLSDANQPAHITQNKHSKIFANIISLKLPVELTAESGTWSNFYYFDSLFHSQLAPKEIKYVQLSLLGTFRKGKLGLINKTYFHKNSDEAVLQIPFWTQMNSLFIEGLIFKKALLVRTGIDARLQSEFKPYAYNTTYGLFYQQQKHSSKFFPMLDFFISMKVKTARIFFKLERMNAFWDRSKNFYYSPFYPTDGASFRMGINWTFLD